ncbi:MAG: prealbumin-like fold domain-containing protein [Collinsella sp.]
MQPRHREGQPQRGLPALPALSLYRPVRRRGLCPHAERRCVRLHRDLALTKRGSDGDKPLAGAVLSIADDHGRTLRADGTWDAEGKATVTTGEDGRVTVSGVDSGKLEVRELKAPKGYNAFEGTRSVTVKAEGLDVDRVAAAKPKLTITAESPCAPTARMG